MEESERLASLGEVVDLYYISGACEKEVPVLGEFIAFAESWEKFMLRAWDDRENGAAGSVLRAEFRGQLRADAGVVRSYASLARALGDFLPEAGGYSSNPWTAFIRLLMSDSELFSDYTGNEQPPLFRLLVGLASQDPQAMICEFFETGKCSELANDTSFPRAFVGEGLPLMDAFTVFDAGGDRTALWSALKSYHVANTGGVSGLYKFFEADIIQNNFRISGLPPSRLRKLHPLYGVEENYQALRANAAQFVAGQAAHHALLWGYRGTGKSSCVLRLAEEFAPEGLRLVEFPAGKIAGINLCFSHLERYKEKFIIFIDDLSFDSDDESYRQLKSSLDGGVHGKGANFIIHATSNRRELVDVKEQYMDERTDGAHVLDEKRAMDDRFGLKVYFDSPQFVELKKLLYKIADESGKTYQPEALYTAFQRFCRENRHTQPSGRSIRQFLSSNQQLFS